MQITNSYLHTLSIALVWREVHIVFIFKHNTLHKYGESRKHIYYLLSIINTFQEYENEVHVLMLERNELIADGKTLKDKSTEIYACDIEYKMGDLKKRSDQLNEDIIKK